MIKFWKHTGICPCVSFIDICFLLFCVCCGVILHGLEVCVELCATEVRGEEWSWVFWRVSHSGSGMLCLIGVLVMVQTGEYVCGESRPYHHFHFSPDTLCLFLWLNSLIQGRCNDWAMVGCGWWIKTFLSTCIESLWVRLGFHFVVRFIIR